MRKTDLSNVQEATDSGNRLPPGGYVCRITSVEDIPEKEYLKIEFDIRDGEYAGYFLRLFQSRGFWAGRYVKSYKESALPFFKRFTTSVEKSNPHFTFDGENEQAFKGLLIGLVIAYEEYRKQDGTIGTRTYIPGEHSVDTIMDGKFEVPALKKLDASKQPKPPNGAANAPPPDFFTDDPVNDDDLPF